MKQNQIPKWQEEVEKMLREQYQGDELQEKLRKGYELIDIAVGLERPDDDYGKIANEMMLLASLTRPPLQVAYAGFMLGVAWERLQNTKGR